MRVCRQERVGRPETPRGTRVPALTTSLAHGPAHPLHLQGGTEQRDGQEETRPQDVKASTGKRVANAAVTARGVGGPVWRKCVCNPHTGPLKLTQMRLNVNCDRRTFYFLNKYIKIKWAEALNRHCTRRDVDGEQAQEPTCSIRDRHVGPGRETPPRTQDPGRRAARAGLRLRPCVGLLPLLWFGRR